MYVYDHAGKGHTLFIRPNDRALHIRDKSRREVCLITSAGEYAIEESTAVVADRPSNGDDETPETVIKNFARDALVTPFDGLSARDFFFNCRAYMLHGVGGNHTSDYQRAARRAAAFPAAAAAEDKRRLGYQERDIDHLDNKRVSFAPSLYALLLCSFARSVTDAIDAAAAPPADTAAATAAAAAEFSLEATAEQLLRTCVSRYGAMSHRANLLPFISRKTHVRHDWCESMKRQMKSEIRSNRRHSGGSGAIPSARCGAAATTQQHPPQPLDSSAPRGPIVVAIRMYTPDVRQDNTKVSQQFYCSKLHLDVEYDHELVKRMHVVNLNAMTCLRMPTDFERFLSYYNVGNIGNAGRVMT